MEALGVAVYQTDADGRLTGYNAAAAELWGWHPPLGEARWWDSWRLYHPDGRLMQQSDCPLALALREETLREETLASGVEVVAERPDGVRIAFISYPRPLRDAAGTITGGVNVLVDVSGRRAAEASLAENSEQLRGVFETTPECIKVVGPDYTVLQMNRSGLRMIGAATPSEIEGKSVLGLIAEDDRELWCTNHERVRRGEALRWEFDIVALNGARHSVETHATPLRLPDGATAQLAITRDVTARRQAQARQELLMREVDHRAKNALAVALSLVRLTRAEDPRSFAEALEGRIAALARAHTVLADEGWSGADLRSILHTELAPYTDTAEIELTGPAVWLSPEAVQPVSMVLHELTTNAAKYGALSVPGGRLTVTLEIEPASGALKMLWTERGGPPLAGAPGRRGFGSTLIQGTVGSQLGGTIQKFWEPEGLGCEMILGATCLQPAGLARTGESHRPVARVGAPRKPRTLQGRRVLLAEDELLVAMEMEQQMRELGCVVLGPAATLDAALRLAEVEAGRIDAAVLDVNLGGQRSFPLAETLSAAGIPVIFATGYSELPDGLVAGEGRALLRKPLGDGELGAALARMLSTADSELVGMQRG